MDFLAIAGALLGSGILGGVKKYTNAFDSKIGNLVKPVQPLVVGAVAVGLPYLTQAIGISAVDAETFATAPTATVLAVTTREILKKLSSREGV